MRRALNAWICLGLALALPVSAPAFLLTPDLLLVKAVGGQGFAQDLTITNDSDAPLTLAVEPETWTGPKRLERLEGWLSIEPRSFVLTPRGRRTVLVKGTVPKDLTGEYLVMLFFASANAGTNIELRTRVGIPLYVCRQGTEVRRARIDAFQLVPDASGNELRLTVELRNAGNVHLAPFGAVLLSQDGRILEQREVRFTGPIFPDQSGKMEVSFPKQSLPGGTLQAELQVFLENAYARDPDQPLRRVTARCSLP